MNDRKESTFFFYSHAPLGRG